MFLLGLWNHGNAYASTPHNIGKEVVDYIINCLRTSHNDCVASSYIRKYTINKHAFDVSLVIESFRFYNGFELDLIIIYDYINNTGENLSLIDEKIRAEIFKRSIVAIYDDVSLDTGDIKIRFSKGTNKHKGAEGLDAVLSKNYWKIRFGVTKDKNMSVRDFVVTPTDLSALKTYIVSFSMFLIETIIEYGGSQSTQEILEHIAKIYS